MAALAENKKARFDYEILETIEAGLVLTGAETKAVKSGNLNLRGAFVTFHNEEAWLTNAHIGAYRFARPDPNYSPTRSRRLLLHQKELRYLAGKNATAGLTIVPLKVYTKNRLVKVAIAVARGRKKYDKREAIKKRELRRELRQT